MASTEDIIIFMEMTDMSYLEAKKYFEDKEEAEAKKEFLNSIEEEEADDLLWSR